MFYNKVEICGVNTSELKTLTDKEKREVLEKAKAGDGDARQKLIYGNLRLILIALLSLRYRRISPIIIGTA